MKPFDRFLLAVLLALCALTGVRDRVSALGTRAELFIYPSPDISVGDPVVFQVRLTTERGEPLYAQPLDVFLDGEYLETLETDPGGSVRVEIDRALPAGTYRLEVVYSGYQFDVPGPAAVEFEIAPVEVVIQTVPSIPDLVFRFDGQEIATGLDGIARLPVIKPGRYELELLPNREILEPRNTEFVQWFPTSFSTSTFVDIPGTVLQQVGFEQKYPAEFEFIDLQGDRVSGSRVSEMLLRASSGDVLRIRNFDGNMLDVNRILPRVSRLDSTTVVYRVQEVIVDGSNVVNQAQQRFFYSPGQPIQLELLLYNVHFSARDLFFEIPFGRDLQLTLPDGTQKTFAFDPRSGLTLTGLARGEYVVHLEANGAITFDLPLVVSRDQEVVVPVISVMDIMLVFGVSLGLIVGLPLWGRRRQIIALLFGRGGS